MGTEVKVKEESPGLLSPTTSIAPHLEAPLSYPGRSIRTTAAQRRAYLRDDPLVEEVEPHQVLCRGCRKWIRLASTSQYTLNNWLSHRLRCAPTSPKPPRRTPSKPNFTPSSRVATAERKIVLLNDPQVKAISTGRVQCGACKKVVDLESEVDYDLMKWTEHKATCIPSVHSTRCTPCLSSNVRRQNDSCADHPTRIPITRVPPNFHVEYPLPSVCRQVRTITHACGGGLE